MLYLLLKTNLNTGINNVQYKWCKWEKPTFHLEGNLTVNNIADQAADNVGHDHAHDYRQLDRHIGGVPEGSCNSLSEIHRAASER